MPDFILDVQGLETTFKTPDGIIHAVNGVSFSVRAGEVLGVAGVQGNGQTELAEALTGLRHIESGHFLLGGKDLTGKSPRLITETGRTHIPEDRQRHGMVLSYTVADNMVLCDYYQPRFSKGVVIQQNQVDANARKLIKEYDVRTPSPYVSAGKLSGGNQQKVIVARWLYSHARLLIMDEPTQGIDIGAKLEVYNVINELTRSGISILLISSDFPELLAISDRVAVVRDGTILNITESQDITEYQLTEMASGVGVSEEIEQA